MKNKIKKNKNIFVSFLIKLFVLILFFLMCFFNFFQKLDYRFYDSMLKKRKAPEIDDRIVLMEIDDQSIVALGEWPWTRDVIGDVLLRMKEFNADSAIFDIEYISPSKDGINPTAKEKIYNSIENTEDTVNKLIGQYSQASTSGVYSKSELRAQKDEIINGYITPTFKNLNDYISNNIARDYDEYFAQALQFFGKAYLTVNHTDLMYQISQEDIDYVKKRMLLTSVTDKKNLIKYGNQSTAIEAEEAPGFSPALHKLMTRAFSSNFTNSVVDADGTRRRMELLFNFQDHYLCQLAFGPFLKIVESTDILRERDRIVIRNAKNPISGRIEDIKIPLDEKGRMLINYGHGSWNDNFKHVPVINMINFDTIEKNIINSLEYIYSLNISEADGSPTVFTDEAEKLLILYDQITKAKEEMLSKCTGYDENNVPFDGIKSEEYSNYFSMRDEFYKNLTEYIDADYFPTVQTKLAELLDYIGEDEANDLIDNMQSTFQYLKEDNDFYHSQYNEYKKILNGSYCILGNTATSTTDTGATPFIKKYMNVGIHANILNTLLNQDFIVNIRWGIGFALAALLAFLMLFFTGLSNAKQNVIAFIAYFIFCVLVCSSFIFSKFYIRFIGTMIYLAVDLATGMSLRFYISTKEKKFITQIASSFANKDTVEQLRKNPELFNTTGQKRIITALFTDIQKFSTFSEAITKIYQENGANHLIQHLNDYLGSMSNEILRNSGNIDKYEGDAIISMFGAPDPGNLHTPEEWAYYSLDSAIRMKHIEKEFNETHPELFRTYTPDEFPHLEEPVVLNPFKTRIGINTGEAFVGLMGSKTETFSKLNYTMIGDTVNLAARLEGVNKAYSSWILCSGDTWNMADSGEHKGTIAVRKLDQVRVVGRSTPVQLYNIVDFNDRISNEKREQIDIFHAALEKYLDRDFKNAGKLFIQADSIEGGDPTSLIFAERCKNFIENGVPEDWDGVINMTSK